MPLAPSRQPLGAERDPVVERDSCEDERAGGTDCEHEAISDGAVIATMAEAMVLYAPDGSIERINPAARKLFGLSEDEASTPTAERLRGLRLLTSDGKPIAPDEQPRARALRGEAVCHQVLVLEGPPPLARRSVSASAVPIRGAGDKVLGVVATFADATRLQQSQQQRDDLVSVVSHDLRTPLSVLLMQAQMLQRSLPPTDRNAKRVDTIISNGQRLANMIRDLVDMVRLENGQFQLARKSLDLPTFVTGLLDRLAGILPTERIRVSCEPNLPLLPADPVRLEVVLTNLLGNALKYSDAPADVWLHASCADGLVTLAVTDHGVGISRQDLPDLFKHGPRNREGGRRESLGIGLYITAMMVRAHGGRIEVESELGKGSVFRVHLPANPAVA